MSFSQQTLRALVEHFLAEDVGYGDVTTLATVPRHVQGYGRLLAKESLVLAGMEAADVAFQIVDRAIHLTCHAQDGDTLPAGTVLAELHGPARGILTAERVALNLLQRLSGVATVTRRYVEAVQHTQARIIDTRKTTPGLRLLEKSAVRTGGGYNHRVGLGDGVLIKDNHIAIAGGVARAIALARETVPHLHKIEIEVETFEQLQEALAAKADVILLDNMTPAQTREAVLLIRSAPGGEGLLIESSGGITLETVRDYAEAGVDLISVGALTHSAPAVDISLELTVQTEA